jgi:hypothetical protein
LTIKFCRTKRCKNYPKVYLTLANFS